MCLKKKISFCIMIVVTILYLTGCTSNNQKISLSNISKIYSLSSVECDANKYVLDLPENWIYLENVLSPDAILSCGNLQKNQYLMMIADSKSDVDIDFSQYTSMILNQVATTLENAVIKQTSDFKISEFEYDATRTAVIGTIDKIKIQYWVYTVDCPHDYLQITTATLQEKANQMKLTYDQMIQTLTILDVAAK